MIIRFENPLKDFFTRFHVFSTLKGIQCLQSKRNSSNGYLSVSVYSASVVFPRYMMLLLESQKSNDNHSLGGLFLYFSDKISDIMWIQSFQMLLQMFRTLLTENTDLSDEKIDKLIEVFINILPT